MRLAEFISSSRRTILFDGAMGTQLAEAGAAMSGSANISQPTLVTTIHRGYSKLGVDLITTNTLTMNRIFIESHGVGVDVRDVNLAGAKLARAAMKRGQYLLGDVSSTGKLLYPSGTLREEDAFETYREQASILAEGGVDGFIVETMIDVREAKCALRACRETGLPVIVSMAFQTVRNGGHTVMGDSARDCARTLANEGPIALGANCGSVTPSEMAEIVAWMKEASSLPIIAQPNAGRPKFADGRTSFDMTPSDFAAGAHKCIRNGARLVGGCCGTSPAHIQALIRLVTGDRQEW